MRTHLAPRDSLSENIRVLSVIVSELKFRDVERQIFLADFVESSDDTALKDRPEAFNRLGMNCADDVLPARMVDSGMRIFFVEVLVSDPLIGAEQANLRRDGLGAAFDPLYEGLRAV